MIGEGKKEDGLLETLLQEAAKRPGRALSREVGETTDYGVPRQFESVSARWLMARSGSGRCLLARLTIRRMNVGSIPFYDATAVAYGHEGERRRDGPKSVLGNVYETLKKKVAAENATAIVTSQQVMTAYPGRFSK